MKKYLYLALLAPSLLMAQEKRTAPSLFNQCVKTVIKQLLPVNGLPAECQEALDFEQKKQLIEPIFKQRWEEEKVPMQLHAAAAPSRTLDPDEVQKKVSRDLSIALRKKENDLKIGLDSYCAEGRLFQTILTNGNRLTLIELDTPNFNAFLETCSETEQEIGEQIKNYNGNNPHSRFSGLLSEQLSTEKFLVLPVNFDSAMAEEIERVDQVANNILK